MHVRRDKDGRIVGAEQADGENQEQHDDTQAAVESALLHIGFSPRLKTGIPSEEQGWKSRSPRPLTRS
ncbi:hypothetical protein OH809_42415 [Streptomyces sp. NBC_00873]|uniref:hypothetical protein n=1 Tax=unclassified Streptomyces TaxID=2593676 RepID=UPI0038667413|nr:hypothetical protein OH809_01295 [Streptomyces sp. NBC_00873]WSY96732.1 hypothetical protein OH809_42415 [Streptomyces sp. NBC_00873]WTA41494.1 hypothetical protein OH821_01285 [Streptomyces sp. NBC_00842]WTA48402.1 hypothetical protein OH821_42525 [Streptomyces sp. NBC_00842]